MQVKRIVLFFCALLSLFTVACRPTRAEAIATGVAQTHTATFSTDPPMPTETATSIPSATHIIATPTTESNSLSLLLVNDLGLPIANAPIEIEDELFTSNDKGFVNVTDIANSVSLFAEVQGYKSHTELLSLVPGENAIEIQLARNPFSLLPSNACKPNEELIFIEDFEDGEGQIFPALAIGIPGFSIETEATGNKYLRVANTTKTELTYNAMPLENTILRFNLKFSAADREGGVVMWQRSLTDDYSAYGLYINTDYAYDVFKQIAEGDGYNTLQMGLTTTQQVTGVNHTIEIATFGDLTEVFMDGQKISSFVDPQPISPGGFSIVQFVANGQVSAIPMQFDNFVACKIFAGIKPHVISTPLTLTATRQTPTIEATIPAITASAVIPTATTVPNTPTPLPPTPIPPTPVPIPPTPVPVLPTPIPVIPTQDFGIVNMPVTNNTDADILLIMSGDGYVFQTIQANSATTLVLFAGNYSTETNGPNGQARFNMVVNQFSNIIFEQDRSKPYYDATVSWCCAP